MKSKISLLMDRIWERKIPFFAVFFCVVFITYFFLVIIDFVPEPKPDDVDNVVAEEIEIKDDDQEETVIPEPEPVIVENPLPIKIIFEELNKEITVLNPQSREIPDLDAALLEGAVRHPDSADFSEPGNIFILGHSSYLPNVFNKNFQSFNGIQDLDWGDTIKLQSADMEYIYFVEDVYQAKAADVTVPMTPGEAILTLSTCNSFGTKDDRFMVEAKLIGSSKI